MERRRVTEMLPFFVSVPQCKKFQDVHRKNVS
jgi:hypothetical protein